VAQLSNGTGLSSQITAYYNANASTTSTHGQLIGDVTGDGKADLVQLDNGVVIVALATGAATGHPPDFGTNAIWYSGSFFGANGTTLADVNGDGLADLVAFDNGQVRVSRSNGSGFGTPEVWLGATFGSAGGVTAADVDGNGKADLIALTGSGAYISRSQ
jgi:hypothetical protein